jgi:DNA excision repair protein ERCC-2
MPSNSSSSHQSWLDYFGHPEPYPHQDAAISAARDVVQDSGWFVMESGCGTGKTMTALTVAAETIRSRDTAHNTAFCLTSVIQQIDQFVDDARTINQGLPDAESPLDTLVLMGKSNICPYTLAGENGFEKSNTNGKCNSLRRSTSKAARNSSFHQVRERAKSDAEQQTLGGGSQHLSVDGTEAPYGADLPTEYGKDVCPFYAKARESEGGVPFTFDDADSNVIDGPELVRLSVEHGICPHTAMSRLIEDADIVIGNYYHAFDYNTKRLTQGILNDSTLLICDEAHMLEPRVRGVLSHQVSLYDLEQAIREILKVATSLGYDPDIDDVHVGERPKPEVVESALADHGASVDRLVDLADLLHWFRDAARDHAKTFLDREYPAWENREDTMPEQLEAPLRDPEVAEQDAITDALSDTNLASVFLEEFGTMAAGVEKALNNCDVDDLPGEYAISEACRLLRQWRERDHEQHFREVTLERRYNHRQDGVRKHWRISLELHNCLPGGVIASQLAKFGGGILMSATLKPFSVYKDVVGLDYLESQHDRRVVTEEYVKEWPPENHASFIVDAPKFTSDARGEIDEWNEVRKQYARAILSVARTEGNILVCMPSYEEATWAGKILRQTDQTQKEVLVDESSSNAATQKLKSEFFAGEGKVLVTSIRGTLTEGVDYRGDRLNGVVVAGVPIPNIGSPRIRALQFGYEQEYGDLGFPYSMYVPAVRKARQALGRVIRGVDDVGVRVLVDERYAERGQGSVQEYLSEHEQDCYSVTDAASLQEKIEAFWNRHNRG